VIEETAEVAKTGKFKIVKDYLGVRS
jgi:hypothetical protein